MRSDSIQKLVSALGKARATMAPVVRDSVNPQFKSSGNPAGSGYASLAATLDACEPALRANGLSVIQTPQWADGAMTLETLLAHDSGEWVLSVYPIIADFNRPQMIGSAVTYSRRYAYMSIVGVAPEDDDGELASGRGNGAQGHQHQPRAPQRQNGHANGHANGNGHAKPAPSQATTAVAPTPRCIKCARMAIQPVTTPAGLVCYECCERRCDFCSQRGKARVERADGKVICKDCSKRQDEDAVRAAFVAAPAPAPAPEARTNNTRLPISGPELYSWASKLERQNGPGLIRHMTERAQNLGWPNCSRIVSWDAGQVADAFADAEECLELIFGASDEDAYPDDDGYTN